MRSADYVPLFCINREEEGGCLITVFIFSSKSDNCHFSCHVIKTTSLSSTVTVVFIWLNEN